MTVWQIVRVIVAGLAWGTWPLMMNRSGLKGNIFSAVFSLVCFASVLPFALYAFDGSFAGVSWPLAVAAGLVGAAGLLSFNGALDKASLQDASTLLIIMVVTQVTVPAVCQIVKSGHLSFTRGAGFVTAIVTVLLLTRGGE